MIFFTIVYGANEGIERQSLWDFDSD